MTSKWSVYSESNPYSDILTLTFSSTIIFLLTFYSKTNPGALMGALLFIQLDKLI